MVYSLCHFNRELAENKSSAIWFSAFGIGNVPF